MTSTATSLTRTGGVRRVESKPPASPHSKEFSETTAVMQLLANQFPNTRETAVIAHDYGTDFRSYFRAEGFSVIRVAADDTDVTWNLFRDATRDRDCREMAGTIFGAPVGNNPFHGPPSTPLQRFSSTCGVKPNASTNATLSVMTTSSSSLPRISRQSMIVSPSMISFDHMPRILIRRVARVRGTSSKRCTSTSIPYLSGNLLTMASSRFVSISRSQTATS
jgi:hypothetical protein